MYCLNACFQKHTQINDMGSTAPRIHLAIMQPAGYLHSQGFLDQARYARYQLRRLGAGVTIGKNRLREDSVNIIFGAHLGFPEELLDRHVCVFFNLEQLGPGGARVSNAYMSLLSTQKVVDYDVRNLAAYGKSAPHVPVISFLHAPYLMPESPLPIQERPIDLLFFGSMNERRKRLMDRIRACGHDVATFDHPVYGAERDPYIAQAKAVLNCHFYETSRFEQARAFHSLSLGTPVVSERTVNTLPPAGYEEAVSWFNEDNLEEFFTKHFMSRQWLSEAQSQLAAFAGQDALDTWRDVLNLCTAARQDLARAQSGVWRPARMNLGSGKDYKPGWLNVDILDRAMPDVVLDLGQPVSLPLTLPTQGGARVHLQASSLEVIAANNVLEHVPDLPCLMSNLLALLKEDGVLDIEVPYEKAPSAWQDPTHVRAMNENSWLYYTGWFWYLGWLEHRFDLASFTWLDAKLQPCEQQAAAFMRVKLRKVSTTLKERALARAMQADFGGIPEDPVPFAASTQEPRHLEESTETI